MSPATSTGNRIEHRIGPRGRLAIRQAAGEIRLRGVEGDRVRIVSHDDRPLNDVFAIEDRKSVV